jgi:hypothetical protein
MSKIDDGESVSQAAPPASLLRDLGNSALGQQVVDQWFACHAPGWQTDAVLPAQSELDFAAVVRI